MGSDRGFLQRSGAIIRILRPVPATVASATVWIGAGLGSGGWGAHRREVALLSLVIFLTVAVANVYNDIRDVAADVINGRPRPIAQGILSVAHAWAVLVVCLSTSLVVAAAVSVPAFLTDLALVAGSLIYSRHLKGTILFGNALVAALGSVPILLGGLANRAPIDRMIAAQSLLFTYMFGYEVLKSLRDANGDAAAGYATVATKLGKRQGLVIWLTLAGAFVALTLWCGLSLHLGWIYFALMVPFVDGTLVFVGISLLARRMTLSRAVLFCTVSWLPGLLAIGRLG